MIVWLLAKRQNDLLFQYQDAIRKSLPNSSIKRRMFVRRSNMYKRVPFCLPEMVLGKLVLLHVDSAVLKSIILSTE